MGIGDTQGPMRVLQHDRLRNVARVGLSCRPIHVLDPCDVERGKNACPEKQRTAIGLPCGLFAQVPGVPTWSQSCLKRRKHVIFNLLQAQDIGCEARNVPHERGAPIRCHEHLRWRMRIPGRPDVGIGQHVVCSDGE
jgi:hypothetical protein